MEAATARLVSCSLCASQVKRGRCTDVFRIKGRKQDLSSRLSKSLLVPVVQNDPLPPFMCCSCKLKFNTLVQPRNSTQVRSCFRVNQIIADDSQRKRTKDTSGDGISPFTTRSRPPAKRLTTIRCLFPQDENLAPSIPALPIRVHEADVDILPSDSVCGASTLPEQCGIAITTASNKAPPPSPSGAVVPKSVKITVISQNSQYQCELQESLVKVGAALAGGHALSIAKAIFSHSQLREHILLKVLDLISAALCKKNPASAFRHIPMDGLGAFCWGDYYKELDQKAPILSRIATSVVKHNDHRNEKKKGTQHLHVPAVCMAIAILLKQRNSEMCGVQSLLPLVLFQSHVQKTIYRRLNHINVCLSYSAVLRLVTEISKQNVLPLQHWLAEGAVVKFIVIMWIRHEV